jgi:hypothetical protein
MHMQKDYNNIKKIKEITNIKVTDIRMIYSLMNNDVDASVEIVQRFIAQGYTDMKKALDEAHAIGAPLTQKRIELAEKRIGYKLPACLVF